MAVFHDRPFMPRRPPRRTGSDLLWWEAQLRSGHLTRELLQDKTPIDVSAFSDASSGVGIGIVIGKRWRAWRLLPGWKQDGRDIGWAEALGMLLLATTVAQLGTGARSSTYLLHGDNRGVVDGWKVNRSRNHQTNEIFRLLHDLQDRAHCTFTARYVRSTDNPADAPSRGQFGDSADLLPRLPIPPLVKPYIVDFEHPLTRSERGVLRHELTHDPPVDSPVPHLEDEDAYYTACDVFQQHAPWREA